MIIEIKKPAGAFEGTSLLPAKTGSMEINARRSGRNM
jgi:hypothetical protein